MKKLSYTHVKASFEKEDYVLTSKVYVNAKVKLYYICPKGHKHSTTWGNWSTGYRCPHCSHNPPVNIVQVKASFKDESYILLTKEYISAKQKLDFICDKGHTYFTTWGSWQQGNRCRICGGTWKGGIAKINLPLYTTYNARISVYITTYIIIKDKFKLLGVNCTYCAKVFVPTTGDVIKLLACKEGQRSGDHRFYCSDNCKKDCSIYRQKLYPKGFKKATSREVQPALRKLVLERDNWTCQKCGKNKDVQLHCHHFEGLKQNPIESADMDNCITLCKKCHKEAHKTKGCSYYDLRCNKTIKGEKSRWP